jgi:predicted Kef-type K+ transport protein
MLSAWIIAAFLLGSVCWRLGWPPLVGFLASGFVFSALGGTSNELLEALADGGVLLLLFAVGLKLRVKTLVRSEVWGSALAHMIVVAGIAFLAIVGASVFSVGIAAMLAIATAFSSTVLAAKVLESNHELRSVHGRIAIGILIVQDLVAIAVLAAISVRTPSPYAVLVLLLPLCRPVIFWALDFVGHGELLVLFGAVLAIAVGGTGFEHLGLSPELGALLLGTLLASHRRAEELSHALWGLKEFFLVGFFLSIGLSGAPTWETVGHAAWLIALIPVKAAVLFGLLLAFGLRARTSYLTALSLATYSEFALIITAAAVENRLLAEEWLTVAAMTVASSFVLAAPINTHAHTIFARVARRLEKLERNKRHPDDEPISLGSSEILIVGMGRVGSGAYDYFHAQGENVVGIDADPGKLEGNRAVGRRVLYADAEDAGFWNLLNIDRLRVILLAIPDVNAKCIAARALRRRGFRGLLSATYVYAEEEKPILDAGCDVTYNYFTEAGVGLARDTVEALTAPNEPTA